jgi:hypothetical protein
VIQTNALSKICGGNKKITWFKCSTPSPVDKDCDVPSKCTALSKSLTEASSATRAAVLSNPIDTSVSRNSALALMIVLPSRGGRINAQKLMSGAETIQVDDETPKKLLSFPVNFQRQTGRCPSLRSRKCRRHRFARAAVQRSLRAHRDGGLGRGPSWGPDENVNTLKMGWGVGVLNPGGERAEGWEPRRKKLLATHH